MEVKECLKSRRSIRNFTSQTVAPIFLNHFYTAPHRNSVGDLFTFLS